jgi:Rad3-related DNA helicase
VRDCIFHYCQINPVEAGIILNRNIWKFWDSYVSDSLIEFGADVNAKYRDEDLSSLLQAILWSASLSTIHKLLEHGADYYAYRPVYANVTYTTLMMALFEGDSEISSLLMEKFPEDAVLTMEALNTMEKEFSEKRYPRGISYVVKSTTLSEMSAFYSLPEIKRAKQILINIQVQQSIETVDRISNNHYRFFNQSQSVPQTQKEFVNESKIDSAQDAPSIKKT